MSVRYIEEILKSKPTLEGAGVRLKRAFGYFEIPKLDPFLLLDDFGSDNPKDYMAGFPWHPHRGIETVTYVLKGEIEHQDSIGNKGKIKDGDVQWMTAGRGIIHQEMPQEYDGTSRGFQLWVNLPSKSKMIKPKYRGLTKKDIKEVKTKDGAKIKIISGSFNNITGPTKDLVIPIEYLDITLKPRSIFKHKIKEGNNAFAYIIDGSGYFDPNKKLVVNRDLVHYKKNGELNIESGEDGVRFLLVSGKPLNEPIAWRGPIVMNTDEELNEAFNDYLTGNFV